jgi:hypothetical protein
MLFSVFQTVKAQLKKLWDRCKKNNANKAKKEYEVKENVDNKKKEEEEKKMPEESSYPYIVHEATVK